MHVSEIYNNTSIFFYYKGNFVETEYIAYISDIKISNINSMFKTIRWKIVINAIVFAKISQISLLK